jgi:GNAT superfamily N-acetyltransferase
MTSSDAATDARPPIVVRPAVAQDVPEIHALIRALAEYEREPDAVVGDVDALQAALFPESEDPAVFAHVVDHPHAPGRLAGMALWFRNFSTWEAAHGIYVEDLFVRPALRGRGIGHALLAHLARLCVERGYRRLEWWVLDWNEPALEFYARIGATPMTGWTVHRVDGPALRDLAG